MILRLLNSLQGDLESFAVGDPQGISVFVARTRAVRRGGAADCRDRTLALDRQGPPPGAGKESSPRWGRAEAD